MANGIKDLENHQFKAELTPLMREILDKVGRNCSYPARLLTCNFKYMTPVITAIAKSIPASASMIRTTTAVTMASGSPAANVLPQKASAVVNFRIMPGQTIDDVEKHIKNVIKNKKAEVELIKGENPSKVSPTDSRCFKALEDICFRMNTNSVVTPYLVMGGTDARHYEEVCDNIYRYSPFKASPALLMTTHGTNERIPVDCLKDAVLFFKHYIRALASD